MILIVTAAELTQEDLEVIKTAVEPDRIETIWVGDSMTTDLDMRPVLSDAEAVPKRSTDQSAAAGQGDPVPPMVSAERLDPRHSSARARRGTRDARATTDRARGRARRCAWKEEREPGHAGGSRCARASLWMGWRGSRPMCRSVGGRRHPGLRGPPRLAPILAGRSARRHQGIHQRHGEFTVNIALIEDGAPAWVWCLRRRSTCCTGHAPVQGAWREEGSGERPSACIQRCARRHPRAHQSCESRSHPSAELEAYLTTIQVEQRVQAGSSLKFCWVAEGKCGLYPRLGPTMEWDVAAGDCIYRESGTHGRRRRIDVQQAGAPQRFVRSRRVRVSR